MWATAILKMVSLSGFLARALQVGTISESSVMYADILFLLLRSISQWFSLANLSLSGPMPPSSSRRPYFCPVGSSSSSLLLGIMVWAVGPVMAIAMLLDVQVHHLHLQLQQLLTTTGSQVNTFLSLGRIGQNLPGSRIWGSQSGHPQTPHPDGPLQLFLLLPLCCSNCYSGCSAAAA